VSKRLLVAAAILTAAANVHAREFIPLDLTVTDGQSTIMISDIDGQPQTTIKLAGRQMMCRGRRLTDATIQETSGVSNLAVEFQQIRPIPNGVSAFFYVAKTEYVNKNLYSDYNGCDIQKGLSKITATTVVEDIKWGVPLRIKLPNGDSVTVQVDKRCEQERMKSGCGPEIIPL
jgi:hypothetical protein